MVDPDGKEPWPPVNFGISLTIGSHNSSVGMYANVSQSFGNWRASAELSVRGYTQFSNTGKKGFEYRGSGMAGFDDGTTSIMAGTNQFLGSGGMSEFSQRTGVLKFSSGDFSLSYENDGLPFGFQNDFEALGDGNDSYRSAALELGVGNFSAGFNLFTGKRTDYNGDDDLIGTGFSGNGNFNTTYPNGFVNEEGPAYRMGAAYIGYGNFRMGINSDKNVRHPIQDIGAHNINLPFLDTRQPGFQTMSNSNEPYWQYNN